jgi:superfamily II DNA helicase RecQ
VCVSFEPSGEGRPQTGTRGKIDYREVLDEADFAVYARLRSLRKEMSDAEGVPVYSLFTNEQMAEMVTRRVTSANALHEIAGVGSSRMKKYSAPFLKVLAEAFAVGDARAVGSGDET